MILSLIWIPIRTTPSSNKEVHRRKGNKGSDPYNAFVSGKSNLLLLSEQENKKRDGSNDDHSVLTENCHRREESRLHLIHDDCPISNSQPRSTQEVESTRDTTIESTSAGIYGIFRYACSMLSSVIGLDLLAVYVINTYVSYCQKLDKKEKMQTVTIESSLGIPNHSANNWAPPIGAQENKKELEQVSAALPSVRDRIQDGRWSTYEEVAQSCEWFRR